MDNYIELIYVDPYRFASEEAATALRDLFDKYIDMRVRGIPRRTAVMNAFRFIENRFDPGCAGEFSTCVEANDYFQSEFPKRLEAARLGDLWNPKKSIHKLLCMVEDEYTREATRLNALKELNVLADITFVDENGNTRRGLSLDDFYRLEADAKVRVRRPSPIMDDDPHSVH